MIEKKNIFIITSCINTRDSDKYTNHNSAHSPERRLDEVLLGLGSVHENYRDGYIIFIESSRISSDDEMKIRATVDEYHNYSGAAAINVARQHYNKGVPQFAALIKFIEEGGGNYCADVFHFLGARYALRGTVADSVSHSGAYFLFYPKSRNVSTRYFFLKNLRLSEMLRPFRKTLYCAILGSSVEDVLYRFVRELRFVDKLGVCGKVNGVEMISE